MQSLFTIGLLGGMSPVSTTHYYQRINTLVNEQLGKHHSAQILLNSVDFQVIENYVLSGNWKDAGTYLGAKAHALEAEGADIILLCTNTMHKVRDTIKNCITTPFVDIIEETAKQITAKGIKKTGILGTVQTMSDSFYYNAYKKASVEIIHPDTQDMAIVDSIIWNELCEDIINESSKQCYIEIIGKMKSQGAEGVILGCTEIQMLISQNDIPHIPVFDTTEIHCRAAADFYLQNYEQ